MECYLAPTNWNMDIENISFLTKIDIL